MRRDEGEHALGVGVALDELAGRAQLGLEPGQVGLIVITAGELWALRYPETHGLYVLERAPGGVHGARPLQ